MVIEEDDGSTTSEDEHQDHESKKENITSTADSKQDVVDQNDKIGKIVSPPVLATAAVNEDQNQRNEDSDEDIHDETNVETLKQRGNRYCREQKYQKALTSTNKNTKTHY